MMQLLEMLTSTDWSLFKGRTKLLAQPPVILFGKWMNYPFESDHAIFHFFKKWDLHCHVKLPKSNQFSFVTLFCFETAPPASFFFHLSGPGRHFLGRVWPFPRYSASVVGSTKWRPSPWPWRGSEAASSWCWALPWKPRTPGDGKNGRCFSRHQKDVEQFKAPFLKTDWWINVKKKVYLFGGYHKSTAAGFVVCFFCMPR
jgi:hypothetical protein